MGLSSLHWKKRVCENICKLQDGLSLLLASLRAGLPGARFSRSYTACAWGVGNLMIVGLYSGSYYCIMHHLLSAVLRKTQILGDLAAYSSSIYDSIALLRSR